jgi:lipoprotein-anchoring transpeptidase ErfK/SrfK
MGSGGFAVRRSISIAVIAFAVAGSMGGASAQYYPPQPPPPGYQGYAPPPEPASPQSYSSAPLPPPDAGEASYGPPPPYSGQPEPEGYPPPPPQPLANQGGPPGFVPPADVTGTVPPPNGQGAGPHSDPTVVAALPPEDQPEQGPTAPLPPQFQRQLVDYPTTQPPGTLIVDTTHTYLYLVMAHGKALRYGIGVGREGFTWAGTERISRMKEWPDWFPPKEMIERQPYLPRFMAGGESNPLGARALYLGNTLYRIHGTNQPSTIGSYVSSGCIRLTNTDIADLYDRVQVGTRVVVLPGAPPASAAVQDVPDNYYSSQAPASQPPISR